ncbi:MAG TPA: DUF5995 family protein [Solirubrobacteraceae bacterium]|jgi:hypothetical protein|nr:DUF5995 family protein [Solirubrobacteraceae bacterium]
MPARKLVLAVAVASLTALAAAPAPTATAEDPPLVNWPALLPALAHGFTPSTFDLCADAGPHCVDHTLLELRARIADHDAACSDNALFARNYRLVTEFYVRFAGTGFFQDDAFLAREDAIFAQLYFAAEDAWRDGRPQDVPEAWRIAFESADAKAVQGAGNLLLGINAHVQRDQPYMLAGLGLVDAQGRSRKPDHDKFNELLNTAYDDVIAQAIEWDDPDLATYEVPGTQADNLLAFQAIAGWREGVWRNAERLVAASTDEERRLVAESIEQSAAAWAERIRDVFRYGGPFTRANRDALCPKRAERAARERAALARDDDRRRDDPPAAGRCDAGVGVRVARRRQRIGVGVPRCRGRIRLAIAHVERRGRCRFVTQRGALGRTRSCRRPLWLRTRGFTTRRLRPGRYVVTVQGDFRITVRVR